MAETHLTPVAGVVACSALTVFVPCRCRVAVGAVRETVMADRSPYPDDSSVAVRTLPGIVILRRRVAFLTLHVLGVVYRTLPGIGGVALRASASKVTVRHRVARLAIR